jgi:hypothetical protein
MHLASPRQPVLIYPYLFYRDSLGDWDWVLVDLQGHFSGFRSLWGEKEQRIAIQKVKELSTP